MLANTSKQREQAESRFKRMQKASAEHEKARSQYEAEGRAMREKTARLRALRLAKEAADAQDKPQKPHKATNPKPAS